MNFLLGEMTHLKYFLPLIAEGNKRGLKSRIFCWRSNKYNCISRNSHMFEDLSKAYNFEIHVAQDVSKYVGPVFCIEGLGVEHIDKDSQTIFSFPYGTDYVMLFDRYIEEIDYSIFPSEEYAIYGKTVSDKNLYLGSPKYELKLDKEEICVKYNLERDSKKAILIYPDARYYPAKIDLNHVYSALKEQGYQIMVKTRGKNPIGQEKYRGDLYFLDKSWHPHTSLELIKVADLVVTHESSSAIKEAVFLKKPMLDMDVELKAKNRPIVRDVFRFFYDYDFHRRVTGDMSPTEIEILIKELEGKDYDSQFDDAIGKYLVKENACSNIIDTAYKLDVKHEIRN